MHEVWMYFETDGDAGYYSIKLFSSREVAEIYKRETNSAYGEIKQFIVHDESVVKQKPYENLKCPECDGDMISRKGQFGVFWGCKSYPNCKGTRDSQGRSKAERRSERENESRRTFNEDKDDRKELNSVMNKFQFEKRKI